ncbi:MauE/DoxX family redox-associated membrane protein [Nonomuraea sp. NPDC001831]|uniref:MauE/DoxX family redox-associated membrane protein n=1 Tax=Nonomuraea sp. NPDC001831 TaxID=3364340 RepID=UPI0036955F12
MGDCCPSPPDLLQPLYKSAARVQAPTARFRPTWDDHAAACGVGSASVGPPEICLFTRVAIGVVFAAAAFGKLRDAQAWHAFADSLLPVLGAVGIGRGARRPVAVALAAAEAAIAPALLFPPSVTAGFLMADVVLVALGGGLARALYAGVRAECRCFGTRAGSPLAARHLVRTMALLLVAVSGTVASWAAPALPDLVPALAVVGAGLVSALLLVVLDDLFALFAPMGS